nr:hypothetical protein [uncultured Holophaga sp.]
MLGVFFLFLLPVGGGIPAGVLLAKSRGIEWPLVALLYFLSDLALALVFEPLLRLAVALARRHPALERLGQAFREASLRSAGRLGKGGPLALVLVAFGVDPMTGRTAALAAGYGILGGWTVAILGDMLYYATIALATLELSTWIRNPEWVVGIALCLMVFAPPLVKKGLSRLKWRQLPSET